MPGKRVLVCGAGAAGLTAAIFAAQSGAEVVILERTDKAGKKILMSGGTRCNVLPVRMDFSDYVTSSSPNRMKHIFRSWSLEDCQRWFTEEIGLKLACEEQSNKWFPKSNSAKEVRDLLLEKALGAGAEIIYQKPVVSVGKSDGKWKVSTGDGGVYPADAVIVCTGGFSIPTTGTDGLGHRFMKEAGHVTEPVYAALTPLTGSSERHKALSGISLDVQLDVYVNGKKTMTSNRSGFLFTHSGYSGPALLDVSHYAVKAFDLGDPLPEYRVNWTAESLETWESRLLGGSGTVISVLKSHIPARLAELLIEEAGLEGQTFAGLRKQERKKLLELLVNYKLPVSGHLGYKKAEVTGGGIPLEEINTATLESNLHPGLYLCGEILDVFGRIGGFNFYWAWVTGRLAGISAAMVSIGKV